jgi:hypothetical protein
VLDPNPRYQELWIDAENSVCSLQTFLKDLKGWILVDLAAPRLLRRWSPISAFKELKIRVKELSIQAANALKGCWDINGRIFRQIDVRALEHILRSLS